jgi:hypothetical protein
MMDDQDFGIGLHAQYTYLVKSIQRLKGGLSDAYSEYPYPQTGQ